MPKVLKYTISFLLSNNSDKALQKQKEGGDNYFFLKQSTQTTQTLTQIPKNTSMKFLQSIFPVFLLIAVYSVPLVSINLVGTYQLFENDIEMVYQVPAETKLLRGVVFLAHGCSHSATDWWPKGASCDKCIGLPVEITIVNEAISRSFAAIAISSYNRHHKCWGEEDVHRVGHALQYFYKEILHDGAPSKTPLYLLGASSGGHFVGLLAQQNFFSLPNSSGIHATGLLLPDTLTAICVQISPIRFLSREVDDLSVAFVPMKKDAPVLNRVEQIAAKLNRNNTKIFIAKEKPLTKTFLYDHSSGTIKSSESDLIYSIFREHSLLDRKTGLLLADPRGSPWRQVSYSFRIFISSYFVLDGSKVSPRICST
jgi:hypothetical protein